jgi:hypothetical protein
MPVATRPVGAKNASGDDHDPGAAIVKFHPDHEQVEAWTQASLRKATGFLGCFQIMMIILFASCSVYVPTTLGTTTQAYTYYIGVEIMM